MSGTEVLIVGAGPTGLTLAIELARRSIGFRLIDAASGPSTGSRGKGIQPRTQEIFDDLGIIEQIRESGSPYPPMRVHLGPFSVRLGPMGGHRQATESTPYPNLWMVSQNRTEAILRSRLAEFNRQPEFGKEFASLSQADNCVRVGLATGELVTARYLVGCDGGRSAVRKAIGLSLNGNGLSDQVSLVADVHVEGLDHSVWHVWPLVKGGPAALCPLPESSLFQLTLPRQPLESIEKILTGVCGANSVRVDWSSSYRPAARMVDRYRTGNVFLAGDAAHVHPPTGGQGLNTGVQDAYNLGWKLAHVLRGGPETLLDSYEEERLPIAAAVLGLSSRLFKTRSLKRGDATDQLSLHYRTSSLSSGVPIGRLSPGDRMPNVRLADGSRLFDAMRGIHATEVVTRENLRILVRPDGYIASVGSQTTNKYAGEFTRRVECLAELDR
jgi:2-polyprenyl-6-methoxyphenol hydroxylase-like FAD-dependent oxidoreductase